VWDLATIVRLNKKPAKSIYDPALDPGPRRQRARTVVEQRKNRGLIIKGLWWWRREARVSKKPYYQGSRPDWLWTVTGKPVPDPELTVLVNTLALDSETEQHDTVWKKPIKLPKAKLLR
jgi:hypothetical protein